MRQVHSNISDFCLIREPRRPEMDDDTKAKFEDIDRRFSLIDKRFDASDKGVDNTSRRFDDVKWHITLMTSVFTLIFAVLSIISGWNYSSDRASLENFKKELKEYIGKSDDSIIELYGLDQVDLAGQEIPVSLSEDVCDEHEGKDCRHWFANFDIIVRNSSNAQSGKIYFKIYTIDPLVLGDNRKSSDETRYDHEFYILPDEIRPDVLPGKYSITHRIHLPLENSPKDGKYPVLIKAYYGKGKVTAAHAYFIFNKSAGSQK
jgi:hypothetical protein